jgi:hypothetical protein
VSYNPQIQYVGDHYAFQGITNAGNSLATAIDEMQKRSAHLQEQDSGNQVTFNTLSNATDMQGNPLLSEDEKQKFLSGNSNQRNGIVTAGISRLAQVFQQQSALSQQSLTDAKRREIEDVIANAGKPQFMTLPDGTVVQGKAYVPGAKAIIDTTSRSTSQTPGAPPPGLTIPSGWVWNGRQLVQQRDQGSNDSLTQLQDVNRSNQLQNLDQQIAVAQSETASGNKRAGPDWLPFTTPYADQVKQLQARREAVSASGGPQTFADQLNQSNARYGPQTFADQLNQSNARYGPQTFADQLKNGGPQAPAPNPYIPGRRYRGKLYIGGDPNNPASWQ